MKVLLTKASDWGFEKVIEINDIMELKDINTDFVIYFANFSTEKKYKDCDFEAMIYDDYIE